MSFKDILVHIDDSKACDQRIDLAIRLAKAHDAHLTGLSVAVEHRVPAYVELQVPNEVLVRHAAESMGRARTTADAFVARVEDAGLTVEVRTERCLEPELADVISLHARYSDMTVVGQSNPKDPSPGGSELPENITLSCGRPTLIVPYIGLPQAIGERIMVAWDAGRESTRAVHDALPILKTAASVAVLAVNPKSGRDGHGERPGADIALHLARHGCRVEAQHIMSGDVGVGDMILSRLADQSIDLLVMGAYGHARMRELILGGVTRYIVRHMTVPVLLSH